MPTATVIPLSPTRTRMKGKQSTTTSATLRTLYHRAARAFLQRDLALAHSLLDSAFKLIFPPGPHDDPLFISHRKKWDILRITLETTVYSASRSQDLPDELQGLLQLSPQSFVSAAYLRSILLFTPSSHRVAGGDAGFLPPNVLTTLVYASLKVVCPDVGRMMIEDWLSKRTSEDDDQEEEGYEKVLELYVLQVLPKLEEWDYAERYLAYETESRWDTRQRLKMSLQTLHSQALASRLSATRPQIIDDQRSFSPAPSTSSSSSSISTTSTHTVVPSTPRPNGHTLRSALALTATQSARASSTGTSTPTARSNSTTRRRSRSATRSQPTPTRVLSHPHPWERQSFSAGRPSLREVFQAYISTCFRWESSTWTFVVLFVLVPIVSLLLRRRRRRIQLAAASSAADLVRHKLDGSQRGFVSRIWQEAVKAVVDTVRMGGSGLV